MPEKICKSKMTFITIRPKRSGSFFHLHQRPSIQNTSTYECTLPAIYHRLQERYRLTNICVQRRGTVNQGWKGYSSCFIQLRRHQTIRTIGKYGNIIFLSNRNSTMVLLLSHFCSLNCCHRGSATLILLLAASSPFFPFSFWLKLP